MKRFKIALYLTALCGLCAAGGATSASAALPEFLPASGTFLSTSGAGKLETSNGTVVECSSDKDKGTINGSESAANVLVTFHGCKSSGFACTSASEPSGLITTKELAGLLGYISKTSKTVGLDLAPLTGTEFVEFNCAGGIVKVKVKGSVIGGVTPINTQSTSGTLTYVKAAGKGKQELTKLEGGAVDLLETSKNGGTAEGSAIETTDTITFHQPTEVMA
jgi:hypothetical protein